MGYYVSLVLMQMATAITCETRTSSLVMQHGLFTNKYLNICLIAEFLLAVAVVYVPALNELLHTEPLEPACWFAVTPFMILLFVVEEVRKRCIRRYRRKRRTKLRSWGGPAGSVKSGADVEYGQEEDEEHWFLRMISW